jgi:hypothetical protein
MTKDAEKAAEIATKKEKTPKTEPVRWVEPALRLR